jgi:hypothetical protein
MLISDVLDGVTLDLLLLSCRPFPQNVTKKLSFFLNFTVFSQNHHQSGSKVELVAKTSRKPGHQRRQGLCGHGDHLQQPHLEQHHRLLD